MLHEPMFQNFVPHLVELEFLKCTLIYNEVDKFERFRFGCKIGNLCVNQ